MFVKAYHDEKCSENKIAMLLHSGGKDLLDIFESFSLNTTEKDDLREAMKKFDEFFIPVTNVTFERCYLYSKAIRVRII